VSAIAPPAPTELSTSVWARLRRARPIWAGIAVLWLLTAFFALTQSASSLYTFDAALMACIGAIALQVMQGTTGLPSVGTAGFLLIGAFGSVYMLRLNVPFPIDVLFGTFLAGLAGIITGLPALRLRGLFLALATLATHFIAVFLGTYYQGTVPTAQSAGFFLPILFGSAGLLGGERDWALLLVVCVTLVILGASCIMGGRSGRAMRMIRDNELVAPAFGISVPGYKLVVFTLTSMVIGFEGGLLAHFSGNVVIDDFPILLAFQYVVMIVVGGLDSIAGAVIGAGVVVVLPIWVANIVKAVGSSQTATVDGPNVALIVYGVLVVFFVAGSPGGIAGLASSIARRIGRRLPASWRDAE
jgi:branched-chain amino acid transport system permease protein